MTILQIFQRQCATHSKALTQVITKTCATRELRYLKSLAEAGR